MIAEKNRAIVSAARQTFLRDGFAEASMDVIAKSAGVSVKTIYSHFENKSELFSHVMLAACSDDLLPGETPSNDVLSTWFPWFGDATQTGLMEAGRVYLGHLLSEEQLALYRVVTRDADRFPDLGLQYQRNVARGRTRILVAFLTNVNRTNGWTARDPAQDAALYEGLLRAGIYEEVLHGLFRADSAVIDEHARSSSRTMWTLLTGERG